MSLVEKRPGQNQEISPKRGGAKNQRSGIYSNNAGELGMKTQDNLAE